MKIVSYCLIFFAGFPLLAQRVDAEGTWEGVLTQPDDSRALANSYPFVISIVQKGSRISGFSRIEISDTQNFAIMEITGIATDGGIEFSEQKIRAQAIKGGFWCIKKGNLKYSNQEAALLGTWVSPDCGRGEIKVYKMSDGAKGSGGLQETGSRAIGER